MSNRANEFVLIDHHVFRCGLISNPNFSFQDIYKVEIFTEDRWNKKHTQRIPIAKKNLRRLINPMARLIGPMITRDSGLNEFIDICIQNLDTWTIPL